MSRGSYHRVNARKKKSKLCLLFPEYSILFQERGTMLVSKDILEVEVHKKRAQNLDASTALIHLRGQIEDTEISTEEQLILSKVRCCQQSRLLITNVLTTYKIGKILQNRGHV